MALFCTIIRKQEVKIFYIKFWSCVIFLFVLGFITKLCIQNFKIIYVIFIEIQPSNIASYLSSIITSILSIESKLESLYLFKRLPFMDDNGPRELDLELQVVLIILIALETCPGKWKCYKY